MATIANSRGPYLGDPDFVRPSGSLALSCRPRTMQRFTRTVVFLCFVTLIMVGCDLMGSDGGGDPPPEDDKAVVYVQSPAYA